MGEISVHEDIQYLNNPATVQPVQQNWVLILTSVCNRSNKLAKFFNVHNLPFSWRCSSPYTGHGTLFPKEDCHTLFQYFFFLLFFLSRFETGAVNSLSNTFSGLKPEQLIHCQTLSPVQAGQIIHCQTLSFWFRTGAGKSVKFILEIKKLVSPWSLPFERNFFRTLTLKKIKSPTRLLLFLVFFLLLYPFFFER